MSGVPTAAREIKIGHHTRGEIFGLEVNIDTIISTLLAGGLVLVLGFVARRYLTKDPEDHVPSKIQLLWETVVTQVNRQVEDNLGKVHPFVAPLAISLFFFILFANWFELLPTKLNDSLHLTPAPTADTNLTYAMAAVAMVSVWGYGIKQKGLGGYLKHFLEPYPVLLPLNILEELVKPITLALRLFGNIFAGGIMLALIAIIPWYYGMPFANVAWKAFDMVIGVIQAFIFALLTVLYFAMAGAGHDDHDQHSGDDRAKESPDEHRTSADGSGEQKATPELAH
jgi:F-type H+-transporting ATPase subunit a